jgi:Reverse transcriptase (RNA-dependent DNA polymerase)
MRSAETCLAIIRTRGERRLPIDDLYRQLFNPAFYLQAYGKIYRNEGALTPGTTPETVDGMSLTKIQDIIDALRFERYRWSPVRRTYIPKKTGTLRPLGMPTWSDKLLQEVLRMLLEAYYEPRFSTRSHGFRPDRGCHTALREIYYDWKATTWFIEGDIRGCFDNLDHQVLMSILREHILDQRFLRLIENLLEAGYLDQWRYHATPSGSPQGGIVSPILDNANGTSSIRACLIVPGIYGARDAWRRAACYDSRPSNSPPASSTTQIIGASNMFAMPTISSWVSLGLVRRPRRSSGTLPTSSRPSFGWTCRATRR